MFISAHSGMPKSVPAVVPRCPHRQPRWLCHLGKMGMKPPEAGSEVAGTVGWLGDVASRQSAWQKPGGLAGDLTLAGLPYYTNRTM